jgi:hypothetical protein
MIVVEEYKLNIPLEERDCRILDTSCPPNNAIKEMADEEVLEEWNFFAPNRELTNKATPKN